MNGKTDCQKDYMQETHFTYSDTPRLKVTEWVEVYYAYINQKKTEWLYYDQTSYTSEQRKLPGIKRDITY